MFHFKSCYYSPTTKKTLIWNLWTALFKVTNELLPTADIHIDIYDIHAAFDHGRCLYCLETWVGLKTVALS